MSINDDDMVIEGADLLEVLYAAKRLMEYDTIDYEGWDEESDQSCDDFHDAWVDLRELVEKI